ncbi:hypothetical protein ACWDOP_34820 [Nocardia sp. NPDC003693]
MRTRYRAGILASAILFAPLAAAATAAAVPLTPAPAPADQVAQVCTMQYPASLWCQLGSLSADAGSGQK